MRTDLHNTRGAFERGAVILSIDTEQIWGYLDSLNERQFLDRFPDALGAHDELLMCLRAAGVSATWFVVGGMALRESGGARDSRMAELPSDWTGGIPSGNETTAPLWYRKSFVDRLRGMQPVQEIGLHGGLTHFIWTDEHATRNRLTWELAEGVKALEQASVQPRSFSFARNQEACYELLPAYGIRSYRGRPPTLAWQLGRTLPGAVLRMLDELRHATPPPVWPQETLPGLWNIPSSTFLYPISRSRVRVAGLRTRLERFRLGVEAAARCRGIFHFCLHPENLTESRYGYSLFEEILETLVRARDRGDCEVMTMSQVVDRMESVVHADPNSRREQTYALR